MIKIKVRGMSEPYIYMPEDEIDVFLMNFWPKFKHTVYMIKHGRKKRIRKKYTNIYEKERSFILKLLMEVSNEGNKKTKNSKR